MSRNPGETTATFKRDSKKTQDIKVLYVATVQRYWEGIQWAEDQFRLPQKPNIQILLSTSNIIYRVAFTYFPVLCAHFSVLSSVSILFYKLATIKYQK
jgi:hypothetical protein